MIKVCISEFPATDFRQSLLGLKTGLHAFTVSYYRPLMCLHRQKLSPTYYLDADLSWFPGWVSTVQV